MKRFIHVGYAKTGTTTLQRHLFAGHPQILGLVHQLFEEVNRPICHRDSMYYEEKVIKHNVEKFIQENTTDIHRCFVFSEERLQCEAADSRVVAERIRKIFYPCTIIIVLREQFDSILSQYNFKSWSAKYAPKNVRGKYIDFHEWLDFSIDYPWISYVKRLQYDRFIKIYCDIFGKENIRILLYEDMKDNQTSFVKKLCRILDVDEQVAIGLISGEKENARDRDCMIDKFINCHFNREILKFIENWEVSKFCANLPYLVFGKKHSPVIRNVIHDPSNRRNDSAIFEKTTDGLALRMRVDHIKELTEFYAKGNKWVQDNFGINLEKHKYALPTSNNN